MADLGAIIKNGIAYNLIYKNGVQYTMIYLGDNRWWTYGTGSNNEIYKRRIMVGDDLNNTPIYHTFPKDYITSLAEQRANSSTNVFLEGTSTNAYIQDFYFDGSGVVEASFYNNNNSWTSENLYSGNTSRPNNGSVVTSPWIWGEGTTVNNFIVKDITNCPSYRHMYIEDSNIRPLEVGDYLGQKTLLYFNIPDDFYKNFTDGETYNSIAKVDSDFASYYPEDLIICYGGDATYGWFGAPMYEIYLYDKNNPDDGWNNSAEYVQFLFDYGAAGSLDDSFGWIQNGIISEVNKDDPYYKYVLVDKTTLGGYPQKMIEAVPNAEYSTAEPFYFSTPITQNDLVNNYWVVEAEDGTRYAGRWGNSEPGGYGEAIYYLSGTDYSITYEYVGNNCCLLGSAFGSRTHTLYKIIPIE
jgi:hypothetical protein